MYDLIIKNLSTSSYAHISLTQQPLLPANCYTILLTVLSLSLLVVLLVVAVVSPSSAILTRESSEYTRGWIWTSQTQISFGNRERHGSKEKTSARKVSREGLRCLFRDCEHFPVEIHSLRTKHRRLENYSSWISGQFRTKRLISTGGNSFSFEFVAFVSSDDRAKSRSISRLVPRRDRERMFIRRLFARILSFFDKAVSTWGRKSMGIYIRATEFRALDDRTLGEIKWSKIAPSMFHRGRYWWGKR